MKLLSKHIPLIKKIISFTFWGIITTALNVVLYYLHLSPTNNMFSRELALLRRLLSEKLLTFTAQGFFLESLMFL